MLPQILMHANLVTQLKGLGNKVTDRLFRPSGWTIPDDTDTGLSFGAGVQGGAGYLEMDIQDVRPAGTNATYEIRGGYIEVGVGIGEISKIQGFLDKILRFSKGVSPGSDLVAMPGGSLTQLIMGPRQLGRNLTENDFKYSQYAYVHLGGELAILAGDVGLIFMMDPTKQLGKMVAGPLMQILPGFWLDSIAWAPYWGTSLGLGAGAKVAVRIIQTVQMNKK